MPGDRVIIAVTFVILGPFVGGVGFWCYVNFAAFLSGAANSWEAALSALPFMLLLGYLLGCSVSSSTRPGSAAPS